jgi:hypothetical protein
MNFNHIEFEVETPAPEHLDYYDHAWRGFNIVVDVLLRWFDAVMACSGVVVCWPLVLISKLNK